MKSSNSAGLFILFAISILSTSVYSEPVPKRGSISFVAYDKDGDGLISEKEFNQVREERLSQRVTEGRPMRGIANAPSFSTFDTNQDGQLTENELIAGQKVQMGKRRNMGARQDRGTGQGTGMRKNISELSEYDSTKGRGIDPEETTYDPRKLVEMPEKAIAIMRKDMQSNLAALNTMISKLALSEFESAGELAENVMGKSTMGKHRESGAAPGRFMPNEMRNLGWGMHEAASEFAEVVKQGNIKTSLKSLEKLTSYCVACHYAYKIR